MADDDEMDGGIYADGDRVMVRPKRTATGVTMGGQLAEAQNAATAAEIVRRCCRLEPLLTAAKAALAMLDQRYVGRVADARDCLRAAIQSAEAPADDHA